MGRKPSEIQRVKMTISLPADVAEDIRILAAISEKSDGTTLSDIFSEFAKAAINTNAEAIAQYKKIQQHLLDFSANTKVNLFAQEPQKEIAPADEGGVGEGGAVGNSADKEKISAAEISPLYAIRTAQKKNA